MQVAVVLEHACIKHFGHIASVEAREVRIVKRHRDFDCTVAAEVEQNHAVTIMHCADGLSVLLMTNAGKSWSMTPGFSLR